jgi:hypothetical protein
MDFCDKCHNLLNIADKLFQNKKGGVNYAKVIESIVDREITLEQLNLINLEGLYASKEYKNLDEEEQSNINEGIEEILSNKKKKNKIVGSASNSNNVQNAFSICNICGFNKLIEPGKIVYEKIIIDQIDQQVDHSIQSIQSIQTSSEVTKTINKEHIKMLIHDPILPRTKVYKCVNDNCKSHKDINIKEAAIFKNQYYHVTYICVVCKSFWAAT